MAQKYHYKVNTGPIDAPWSTDFFDEGFSQNNVIDCIYEEYNVFFQGKVYSFYNKNFLSIGKEMNRIFLKETRKQKLSQSQFTA